MTRHLRTVYATVSYGFIKESRSRLFSATNQPPRWYDHRLAILVYQGSDPTVPYQALVIRESAMLC
jgi:hypothetical protein